MSDEMVAVEVRKVAAAKIALLARAWRVTGPDAVDRLLAEFEAGPRPPDLTGLGAADQRLIAVHAEYQDTQVRGQFDPVTGALEIIEGPGAKRRYKTPSAAAIAVVSAVNPSVNPNRNGWSFFTVTETGERLQSRRFEGR